MDKIKKKKKLEALEELLLLTKGRCLLSFNEENEFDRMSYHHLEKRTRGGPRSFDNGVPLLRSNHDFLNIIEREEKILYCELNCALDTIKEAMELYYFLRNIYNEYDIQSMPYEPLLEDLSNEEFDDIDETMEVQFLSKDQLISIRGAIKIYIEEVVPAFLEAKNKYANGDLYQLTLEDLIPLKKEKNINTKNKNTG